MFCIRTLLQKNCKALSDLITTNLWTRSISTSCRSGVVMSFGDSSNGALGLPDSITGLGVDAYEPTIVPNLPEDVVSIGAGHYHSLVVTSQGEVWAWGRNLEAQLGRGLLDSRGTWNEPKRVEGLNQVHVHSVFASGVISAAIGDDGSLWVWGKSKRGQLGLGKGVLEALAPSRVEALAGEKITKVSFGWGHAFAQTEDGKLFGWGYSADGRLGKIGRTMEAPLLDSNADTLKDNQQLPRTLEAAERLVLEGIEKEKDMPIVWDPCLVEELHDTEVLDIACGLDHSLILCRNGTVLSSGANTYGQLGRAKNEMGLFPIDLSIPVLSIASGLGHSLAICEVDDAEVNGRSVYSWGWNQSSMLGRLGPEDVPREVEALAGNKSILVSAGRVHSLVLTSTGEVWVWGCGRNGRLGLGSSNDEAEPVLLDSVGDCEVLQAVAGFDHTLVLVEQ